MPTKEQFLADIRSDSADARFAAWRQAGQADPEAIPELGRLAAGDQPGVAKAAREALHTMVHAVGKESGAAQRAAVVKQLLAVTGDGYPPAARALAFRLLSLIAGDDAVAAIARSIRHRDLREEVVFCLERIPGGAAIQALLGAYRDAAEDFKPRLLAAFGHRRAAEALPVVVEAMRSPNRELALAAVKAYGRIGRKPAAAPRLPDPAGLSDLQRMEHLDSQLRWADAQAAAGNGAEAMQVYQAALARPEEHLQCAAIIGIARLGTPEAATVIFPKLRSDNRTVRITARNAWQAMAR